MGYEYVAPIPALPAPEIDRVERALHERGYVVLPRESGRVRLRFAGSTSPWDEAAILTLSGPVGLTVHGGDRRQREQLVTVLEDILSTSTSRVVFEAE